MTFARLRERAESSIACARPNAHTRSHTRTQTVSSAHARACARAHTLHASPRAQVYTAPDDEVEEPPAKRGAPKALKGPKKGAVKKPKAAKKK